MKWLFILIIFNRVEVQQTSKFVPIIPANVLSHPWQHSASGEAHRTSAFRAFSVRPMWLTSHCKAFCNSTAKAP